MILRQILIAPRLGFTIDVPRVALFQRDPSTGSLGPRTFW